MYLIITANCLDITHGFYMWSISRIDIWCVAVAVTIPVIPVFITQLIRHKIPFVKVTNQSWLTQQEQ